MFIVNTCVWLLWQPEDWVMQLEDHERAVPSLSTQHVTTVTIVLVCCYRVEQKNYHMFDSNTQILVIFISQFDVEQEGEREFSWFFS